MFRRGRPRCRHQRHSRRGNRPPWAGRRRTRASQYVSSPYPPAQPLTKSIAKIERAIIPANPPCCMCMHARGLFFPNVSALFFAGQLWTRHVQLALFDAVHPLMPRWGTALKFVIRPAPACGTPQESWDLWPTEGDENRWKAWSLSIP